MSVWVSGVESAQTCVSIVESPGTWDEARFLAMVMVHFHWLVPAVPEAVVTPTNEFWGGGDKENKQAVD